MVDKFTGSSPLKDFSLWRKLNDRRVPVSFDLEITARCNHNCRHCYINLPAGNKNAKKREMSLGEIEKIADQAVSMGSLWCLISGGEPLLREDFNDIYLMLKKKGLLVSVFTNGCLINKDHVALFNQYPPRDIEISVYGITQKTYESITRRPGSFSDFMEGLNLLFDGKVKVRLKAMALRSNVHEMSAIADFCREKTLDYFRFDPFLHLRYDNHPVRNKEILSERLSPDEIASLECSDKERFESLSTRCNDFIFPTTSDLTSCHHIFRCGAGQTAFTIGYDGSLRLCSSLQHPDYVYNLRKGTLADAWENFIPFVRRLNSEKKDFLEKCGVCPIINLCMWCPAHAHLETGELDAHVDYFCKVAHARAKNLRT
jgi:radical SAM protein with 4Fe4S-binding SPASM domain